MKLGIIHGEPIDRAVWRAVHPLAKIRLLVNKQVVIGDDGLVRPNSELLAAVLNDINEAMSAGDAP